MHGPGRCFQYFTHKKAKKTKQYLELYVYVQLFLQDRLLKVDLLDRRVCAFYKGVHTAKLSPNCINLHFCQQCMGKAVPLYSAAIGIFNPPTFSKSNIKILTVVWIYISPKMKLNCLVWQLLKKFNINLLHDPRIPFVGISQKRSENTHPHKDTQIFIAASFIIA